MLKKNYILLAILGVMLTITACSDDVDREPSPEVNADCMGISFDLTTTATIQLTPDSEKEVTIKVTRDNTKEGVTIPINIISQADVFTIPESVTFAAGESETEITVTFPNAQLAVNYVFEMEFPQEYVNPYKGTWITKVTVYIGYTWVDAGTVDFTDPTFLNGATVEIPILRAKGYNVYRLPDLYYNLAEEESAKGCHLEFILDDNYNAVSLNPENAWVDLGIGWFLRYMPVQYPQYCYFENEGNAYEFGYLMSEDKSGLYIGEASFVWNDRPE